MPPFLDSSICAQFSQLTSRWERVLTTRTTTTT